MDSESETEIDDSAVPEKETAENAAPETDGPEMETAVNVTPGAETDAPEMETSEYVKPEAEIHAPEMETAENAAPESERDESAAPEMETSFSNPWNVSDASVFLKYCCPECDYQFVQLEIFVIHATKYHDLSRILFEETKINSEHVKEEPFSELLENSEVIEDASEHFDDFIDDDSHIDDHDFVQGNVKEEPFSKLLENSEVIEEASEHFNDSIEDDGYIDEDNPIKLTKNRKNLSESDPVQIRTRLSPKDLDEQNRDPSCEKGQGLKCEMCDKEFLTEISLERHIKYRHGGKCGFCDNYFLDKNSLESHISSDHRGCNEAFAKKPLTIEMDENCWLTCDKCPNEKFYFIFELQLHREKVHKNEVKHITPYEDRYFIEYNFAKRQMIFQKNGWKCKTCEPEVKFEHKFQMITHWHEKHSSGGLYEPCQWCCEVFQSPDQNLVSSFSKLHT